MQLVAVGSSQEITSDHIFVKTNIKNRFSTSTTASVLLEVRVAFMSAAKQDLILAQLLEVACNDFPGGCTPYCDQLFIP